MIAVDGGKHLAALSGFPLEPVTLSPYFIDRTEVTNAAFKEFVDAGGYKTPEYWQQAFRQGDRVLDWKQAMALFVDTTGRPGPAGWELGRYAPGHEDYPVGGVSWFEAAAYAAFRGKELPTVYHWIRAALPSGEHTLSMAPEIVPMSNFGGTGPAPVGSFAGIGVSGAVDLAGNLREWCWNESRGGRVALGGAWSDPAYAFTSPARPSAFDRSLVNGFRLMLERDERSGDALRSPVTPPGIDVYTVKAISDEDFARNKGYFAYSDTPLNPVMEPAGESAPDWRRESVSIDAAYGKERFTVHLDLPTTGDPPYRAVVYFPGSNATEQSTFEDAYWERFDYVPRSGRALVRPVLAGMYERSDRPVTPPHRSPRDQARAYVQDLGRTLDYLETRGDIDVSGLAYMGLSLGAAFGPLALAYEDRCRVAIFIAGGLSGPRSASTAPRVTVPVLLLGGRYDYMVPADTSQKALFDLLGTPSELKRRVIFEAGHLPLPRADVIRETLEWLDRYQGPVAR
jgi:pimeloyl-ACP methyl ester carboxylesterase